MRIRSAFGNVQTTIDTCGPVRHFFARLRLCKHHTKTFTFTELLAEIYKAHLAERHEALYESPFSNTEVQGDGRSSPGVRRPEE